MRFGMVCLLLFWSSHDLEHDKALAFPPLWLGGYSKHLGSDIRLRKRLFSSVFVSASQLRCRSFEVDDRHV
jgi:hypothetical protein